ncbi:MAG: hypothetical protein WCP21_04825, partial [Armatimonadota bacterium]
MPPTPTQRPDDAPLDIKQGPAKKTKPFVVRRVGEKGRVPQWLLVGGIPGLLLIVGAVVVFIWLGNGTKITTEPRVPQAGAQVAGPPSTQPVPDAGAPGSDTVTPAAGAATVPTATASSGGSSGSTGAVDAVPSSGADWTGFRGPNRNGISGDTGLLRSWGAGPQKLWSIALGEGHAGAAVYGSKVYVLDYDQGARA